MGTRRAAIVDHGHARTYRHGCRCAECRTAWAQYIAARRRIGEVLDASRTYYPEKVAPPATVGLTELAHDIVRAVQARTGRSRSDIIEHLIRRFGPEVEFERDAAA